jgi:hypothetical protein
MANHVFIANPEGTLLWEGASSAAFLGLQPGESFWFGSLQERVWVSIISISYGLDTATGDFHVELVVNETSPKPTKTVSSKRKDIDHGVIECRYNGMTSIDNGRLVVVIGYNFRGSLTIITIQANTAHGPLSKTETFFNLAQAIHAHAKGYEIIATLTSFESAGVKLRITEHMFEE